MGSMNLTSSEYDTGLTWGLHGFIGEFLVSMDFIKLVMHQAKNQKTAFGGQIQYSEGIYYTGHFLLINPHNHPKK